MLDRPYLRPKNARCSARDWDEDSRGFASISTTSSAISRCADGSGGALRSQLRRALTFA